MLIDTHAHYDDAAFDEDRKQLISSLQKENIIAVNVGASLDSSREAVFLAHEYDNIFAAVGMHPDEVYELNDSDMDTLKNYSKDDRVLAIGEIGLDYSREDADREVQKYWFSKQLDVAREVKLPVLIHSRDAAKDTFDIMKEKNAGEIGGVVHCYSYGAELAKEYLKMGMFFGIGGVVTFKNAKKLKEVVEFLPINSIVLETDSPYLAPEPNRGKRNSSLNLKYVVKVISEIKGISEEEVISVTGENALRLYPRMRQHLRGARNNTENT